MDERCLTNSLRLTDSDSDGDAISPSFDVDPVGVDTEREDDGAQHLSDTFGLIICVLVARHQLQE
jgi:hypothetical protein